MNIDKGACRTAPATPGRALRYRPVTESFGQYLDSPKDRSKVFTPEKDREKDQGKVLTPKIDRKIDQGKVLGTKVRFL